MAYKDLEIGEDGLARCGWVGTDSEYMRYHDEEWGVKLLGDQKLFEKALTGSLSGRAQLDHDSQAPPRISRSVLRLQY